jgi:CheY-like chemotaxis protein
MPGILAIESDRKRRALLATLLRNHARVDVTMVDSVQAAIDSFEKCQPDLIVAPTLLPPEDSDALCAFVKRHAGPHVQMLTIPALDMLREPPVETGGGIGLFRRRRPVSLGLQYDPQLVGLQIAEGVERARQLREQWAEGSRPPAILASEQSVLVDPNLSESAGALVPERRLDVRMPPSCAARWNIRLPGGSDIELVNISRTGILLESRSRFSPGVTLDLMVSGLGQSRIAPARFVRSEVAAVDRLGVRYYTAAQFTNPLDIIPSPAGQTTPVTPQSLADLFTTVLSDSSHLESGAARFARGLRGLIGARDVLIGAAPTSTNDGSESIYFTVRTDGASRTILQVMFDRHRAPSATEFALLKAAVAMTTAVLELEHAFATPVPSPVLV